MAALAPVRTVLVILDGHKAEVNQIIEDENPKIKGPTCENIKIASDVGLAVDNVRNDFDYQGILDKLVHEVGEVFANRLEQLKKLVEDLKGKDPMVMASLSSRALALSESLVITGWRPKFLGLCPTYLYVSNNGFKVLGAGRFKYPASYPDTCSLKIPDVTTKLVDAKEGGLAFEATNMLGKEATEAKMKNAHAVKGELAIKYQARLAGAIRVAKFDLWILCFPLSPGPISLTTTVVEIVRTETRPFSTPVQLMREDEKDMSRSITVGPSEGWRMSTKPKFTVGEEVTDVEDIDGQAIVRLKLPEGQEKIEGKVEFNVERDVYGEVEYKKEIWLKWGDIHNFKAIKFNAICNTFDGQRLEFKKPDSTKPYLKVVQGADNNYKLVAEVPSTK